MVPPGGCAPGGATPGSPDASMCGVSPGRTGGHH